MCNVVTKRIIQIILREKTSMTLDVRRRSRDLRRFKSWIRRHILKFNDEKIFVEISLIGWRSFLSIFEQEKVYRQEDLRTELWEKRRLKMETITMKRFHDDYQYYYVHFSKSIRKIRSLSSFLSARIFELACTIKSINTEILY